ncbi:hypothetical protein FOCG_02880 [Fusarium oxysporum f. sp. radicis-lycopersici 26381]|uniref:Uncharacterized protein n=2 Tax=Fusarium oxysporum TaxID=5507 RepID=W9KBT3_FUSOX|nr:hypothetical protein FOZG_06964 [Fusarium oxysporum Fo47]EXA01091.1 hypothetical protein FOWG_01082 [Fusarium oxysporum f. sp. lycopersici MN25]EXL59771.1 hypothetical protein FOCG_02880 [Fusarium oxysporum f. sp. radicis-lycopersici 26381]
MTRTRGCDNLIQNTLTLPTDMYNYKKYLPYITVGLRSIRAILKLSPDDALSMIHVDEFAARKLFAYRLASLQYLLYLEYKPVEAEHETAEDRTGQGRELT